VRVKFIDVESSAEGKQDGSRHPGLLPQKVTS
jgi:hypothetical protein